MKSTDHSHPPEREVFKRIQQRVKEKSTSYDQYNFSDRYDDFLKIFFDLAQEFDSLEDFYRVCVAVPLEVTGFDSALYIYNEKDNSLELICDSTRGVLVEAEVAQHPVRLYGKPRDLNDSYLIPIYSKPPHHQLDKSHNGEAGDAVRCGCNIERHLSRILGMYEVRPLAKLTEVDKFFFIKFANRIGYKLHNWLLSIQNIDHIKFINNLVMDIEHNVIVPNMYFVHLFNQLRKKIGELGELEKDLRQLADPAHERTSYDRCLAKCAALRQDLFINYEQLTKHHANISLFLESLFRREHFQRGHLVLRLKYCAVGKEIILPQLEYYSGRLRAAGVAIEHPQDLLAEDAPVLVDVGLLSQVFANLFSNAAKYTKAVAGENGSQRKAMYCRREIIEDFPSPGKNGVKYSVVTTGPHISPEEGVKFLQEGVRGENSKDVPGTGHGLAFIRHVVEMHGGCVGYEQQSLGNSFYFILPLPSPDLLPTVTERIP